MTDTRVITAEEMADRLAALCTGGDLTGLPRRERDVAILLASATFWMEQGAVYKESEVNEGLALWLETVCPPLRLDSVTLRRELVDRAYLNRDDSGTHYSPGTGPATWRFEDDVAELDPAEVVAGAITLRADRKRAHLQSQES